MKRSGRWQEISKDKTDLRRTTAAKSFAEKLRIVEQIRDRDAAVRRAKPASNSAAPGKKGRG